MTKPNSICRLTYPELRTADLCWSSQDCARAVAVVKQYLRGVGSNVPVALVLQNSYLSLFIYLALLELGSIAVSINIRCSEQEIQDQLDQLNCQFVISDHPLSLAGRTLVSTAELASQLQRDTPQSMATQIYLESADQIQGIFFTSGTTGKPKGVQLTVGNHYHSAQTVNHFLKDYLQVSSPHWLLTLPLYHVGGMGILWRVLVQGGAISLVPKFDGDTVIGYVRAGNVNLISLVPTMLKRILAHELFLDSLSSWQNLKGIFLGGARADRSLLEQCLDYQLPVFVTYGMTECASQVSILDIRKFPQKLDSVGQVLDHILLAINNPDPRTGVGEIAIQSASLTSGYYGDDSLPLNQKGYYLTGDLGYIDRDQLSGSFLYLVDRRTDLIISGGENVYPKELEQILIKHPQIEDVVVIARADPEWGQVPAVVYKGAQNLTLRDLQTFCLSANLSRYKLPKYLDWVEEMPLTNNAKIDRQLLRKRVNQG